VLRDLRAGSKSALACVYDRYSRAVYGLALGVLGNPDDAADVMQEVFLKLPRAARCYRGEAPFGAWLRRLASNATIDLLRGRRRLVALDSARHELAEASAPGDAIEAQALLDRLSPTARVVLLLHVVEGYTHVELADLFKQSESYSKSILSRSLRKLRTVLDGGTGEKRVVHGSSSSAK
jgi:RNA polymerase sigma factor (sigma-70 family)